LELLDGWKDGILILPLTWLWLCLSISTIHADMRIHNFSVPAVINQTEETLSVVAIG
jgi:hypothetical protein